MIKFENGKVGINAHKVCKVWKIGFHIFLNGGCLIFRVCYLRNKKGTHYIQMSVRVKENLDCAN